MSQPGCMMIPDHGAVSFVLVYSKDLAKDDDREVLQYSGCPDLRV